MDDLTDVHQRHQCGNVVQDDLEEKEIIVWRKSHLFWRYIAFEWRLGNDVKNGMTWAPFIWRPSLLELAYQR